MAVAMMMIVADGDKDIYGDDGDNDDEMVMVVVMVMVVMMSNMVTKKGR